jgi:hypothetical protein
MSSKICHHEKLHVLLISGGNSSNILICQLIVPPFFDYLENMEQSLAPPPSKGIVSYHGHDGSKWTI